MMVARPVKVSQSRAALTHSEPLRARCMRRLAPIGLLFLVGFITSALSTLTRPSGPPSAQTKLSVTVVSSSEIDLSWTAPASNISGYKIFRNDVQIAALSGVRMTYHDTQLAPSTTYVERVAAFDSSGRTSGPSASATATTLDVPGRSPGTLFPPDGAIVLNPGDSIQSAVNANPSGTTFYLNAGIYRQTSAISPKSDDVFEGTPGAILNGSKLLASFTRQGPYYLATGVPRHKRGTTTGFCDPNHPLCRSVQDLYFDDKPLVPVSSISELGPHKWYLNRTDSILYLCDNPSGHTVEIGFSYAAFDNPSAVGVTIDGLTVEKYATEGPLGAVGFVGDGWIVKNNNIRLNHASGVNIHSNGIVLGNYVHDNGEEGITGGNANNVVVANNEISFNNYSGYDCQWECGGSKFSATTHLTVLGNYVHDNLGFPSQGNSGAPGLWCDVDCLWVTFTNNVVLNNGGSGIFCEVSHFCTISYNILEGNGYEDTWGFGAGIAINETDHATVYGNILVGNHIGIGGVQQNQGSGPFGTHELTNLNAHDNIITITAPSQIAAGLWQDDGDTSIYTSKNNVYQHNTYKGLSLASHPFHWTPGFFPFQRFTMGSNSTQWQAFGNDRTGTFDN